MTEGTKIYVNDQSNDSGERLVIYCELRTLNPDEYQEVHQAIRKLQTITDRYIYGGRVQRPDEVVLSQELEEV